MENMVSLPFTGNSEQQPFLFQSDRACLPKQSVAGVILHQRTCPFIALERQNHESVTTQQKFSGKDTVHAMNLLSGYIHELSDV